MNKDRYARAFRENAFIHLYGSVNMEMVKGFRADVAKFFERQKAAESQALTLVESRGEKKHSFDKVATKKEGPIIVLNSSGGDVSYGLALCDELARLAIMFPDLVLLCEGNICSMAVAIALAVPKANRLASPSMNMYSHRNTLTLTSKVGATSLDEHEYRMKEDDASLTRSKLNRQQLLDLTARGTGMTPEAVLELFENPRYLTAIEAKELGFVSDIFTL